MKVKLIFMLLFGLPGCLHAQSISPDSLIQQQLAGYNARDVDAFAATYSDSIEVFNLPSITPSIVGKAALKTVYGKLFTTYPAGRAAILNRIVQGNYVIDKEHLTGRNTAPYQATVIYQVEKGLVRRVWIAR